MSHSQVEIRPLTESDHVSWYKMWQAYLQFYNTSLAETVTASTWSKILDNNSSVYGFAAFKEGQLIGISHVVLHPNTWNTTECCYLEDLYVDNDARGLGVGKALIEHVYQFAHSKNCNRVYWVTDATNTNARHLYNKIALQTDVVQYRKDL